MAFNVGFAKKKAPEQKKGAAPSRPAGRPKKGSLSYMFRPRKPKKRAKKQEMMSGAY